MICGRRPIGAFALVIATMVVVASAAALVLWTDRTSLAVAERAGTDQGTPAGPDVGADGPRLAGGAKRAFARGIAALQRGSALNIGELWFLQKLCGVHPDEDLGRLVERAVERLASNRAAHLVNPTVPRAALPANPGRGMTRLANYVLAPAGKPESRAIDFIADFVASEETGYVLTHQLLVLEWAQSTGLELPDTVRLRKQELLGRIAREHAAAPGFSDLFAERATILLAFAPPPPAEAARWIDTILAAQLPDGRWVQSAKSYITYDGQTSVARHPWTHTSGFAAAAIGFYLVRYAAEP